MRVKAPTGLLANNVVLQREPDGESCTVRCVHPESVRFGWETLLPEGEYKALAFTFSALADPSRLKIVYSLATQQLCTCDLAAIASLSESSVSQHLKVLRDLRLIKSRREGKVVYHSLDDEHIGALLAVCLEHVRDERA